MKDESPKEAWIPCNMSESEGELSAKNSIESISIHMRKITLPTKPKVGLEELMVIAGNAYTKNHGDFDHWMAEIIKAIISHLGIELEEPKGEWEQAYHTEFGKIQTTPHERTAFKIGFEAGQACEKSKEK